MSSKVMTQTAPFPVLLADLVQRSSYKEDEGWAVALVEDYLRDPDSRGLTLIITRCGPDTYHPERVIAVNHLFAVPPATYNKRSWAWWLFQRYADVEKHELMETFKLDGKPLYPPAHGPGNDPYLILHYGSDIDRRTSFRGEVNDEQEATALQDSPAPRRAEAGAANAWSL